MLELDSSSASQEYSPVLHLATALFPASDKTKYMMMLSAYMDETGHSKDELQKFNGMAGLFAPADNWIDFERKWSATLRSSEFRLPYFHMKEFEARHPDTGERMGFYKGWNEEKRRKLYGRLMRIIHGVGAMPIGSIIAMDDWRQLVTVLPVMPHSDPYFLVYQNVIAYATSHMDIVGAPADDRVAFVFSDQVEFKYRALQLYDEIYKVGKFIKRSADAPDFRDMRRVVPLQAADIIAYEFYKEYDRRKYRPHYAPRWGYGEIEKMSARYGFNVMCRFYSTAEITEYAQDVVRAWRKVEYWKKQRAKKKVIE